MGCVLAHWMSMNYLVKLKPNGKARICIDMSAPHDGADSNKGEAAAVNSGIDAKEFPTKMSST